MIFSLRVKQAREKKNMSQIELIRNIQERYGISISTSMLSRYEDEKNPPPKRMSIEALFALAVYLNLDLNEAAREEVRHIQRNRKSNNN